MKKFFLYLWQLPQNLIGLLVILFTKAKKNADNGYYLTSKYHFGVSLGNYVIFGGRYIGTNSIKHEQGHQKQSKYLGWLYLLIIGLPSASFNLFDQWFHKKWSNAKRIKWYYNLPWEHWADKLGGVNRQFEI